MEKRWRRIVFYAVKLIQDKYRKARGGYSRLLEISCSSCHKFICNYQKDGPGIIKRMYVDRISNADINGKILACPNCKNVIGSLGIYEKEQRPAYNVKLGSISKTIIKLS